MNERGHIGDGVYVSDDGYQIWLAANDHYNKVIALEPNVFINLVREYLKFRVHLSKDVIKLATNALEDIKGETDGS